MNYKIKEILEEKVQKNENISLDVLYNEGMRNVRENIEFYFDKPFSCESVIKELFVRGVQQYIDNFPYLEK